MSRISPLTALYPAFACPAFKASVADAMEGGIPAFRYLKFFSLGHCSGYASLFPAFFGALNPFTFSSYPGHIRFFPAFFGALNPFTFSSYPGHIRWFPAFDGVPRRIDGPCFMVSWRVSAHFRARRRSSIRSLSESLTGSSVPVSDASSVHRVMSPEIPAGIMPVAESVESSRFMDVYINMVPMPVEPAP
jgi:hypothetical protein